MINKLCSQARQAIEDYRMICDGDKIAVGLSGGKDSLTLATILKHYQRFSPQRFEVIAIIIDLYNGKTDYTPLLEYCKSIGLEVQIINSKIYDIVFNQKKEGNPCSLCAKLRRGILNTKAKEFGCNKIALGHHSDDVIETFFLSLFYEGRLSTFQPVTYLSDADVTIIRPFFYIRESSIIKFTEDLPVIHNCCPADKKTKREDMKTLLRDISEDIPFVKDRILKALVHTERNNLIAPLEKNVEKRTQKKLARKQNKEKTINLKNQQIQSVKKIEI